MKALVLNAMGHGFELEAVEIASRRGCEVRVDVQASARGDDRTAAMVEEYGGVVKFAGLIVQSGVNAFVAAEQALQVIPWTRIEAFLEPKAILE